jgi:branched-chain amino acid aminotransferase
MSVAVVIDGRVVAPADATVSVFDRGLLYGDGLFEVLRTWLGVAIDLGPHLDRLAVSARALKLNHRHRTTIAEWVEDCLRAAGAGEHRLRIVVTRGPGPLSARLGELHGRTIVIAEPLPPRPATLTAITLEAPPPRPGSAHKTLAYLEHLLQREHAAVAGADEAIGVDRIGHVVEGATSNVFAILGDEVITPPADRGALPGIVRAHVLALAPQIGLTATVRPLAVDELRGAREIFVTSSLRGVVPIVALDHATIGTGAAGPTTTALAAAYDAQCYDRARRR